ncbi:EAL domain-containing protein [Shewanella eurypsychrophilus]|uniref:EAL domain-containing protein n=1 Tax=Shewanella eurypsychrophilus TaxID=2593656 RepID=A0ABX6VDK2_9GAMM|nr:MULTISPECIES: EAL domain-containing protein [Shewanella]QFU24702.1 EAL domain-containing protein [Shewanella sp. YLB-09]QPG59894.1 EAL domain-containing protein [Shewanella eurypsychrophilus]
MLSTRAIIIALFLLIFSCEIAAISAETKGLELGVNSQLPHCSILNKHSTNDAFKQAEIQLVSFPILYALTNNKAFISSPTEAKLRFTHSLQAIYSIALISILIFLFIKLKSKRREHLNAAKTVRESEERLKLALWASGDGMWDWHIEKNQVFRSNISNPILLGNNVKTLLNIIHPKDRPKVENLLEAHLTGKTVFFEAEYRIKNEDGSWMWLLDRGKVTETDNQNRAVRMTGTLRDITAKKQTDNTLRLSAQVLDSMREAVIVGDNNHQIISVNPAFTTITGFSFEEVLNKHILDFASNKKAFSQYRKVQRELSTNHYWSGESTIVHSDGRQIPTWLEVTKIDDHHGNNDYFVAVFNDISARKKAEEDLRFLANYDALTGLPNRSLFQDRIQHATKQANRTNRLVALLFIDLDRFKYINDSMGHHVGDQLLKSVAQRLRNIVRQGDTVARIGGDEFTIILENLSKQSAAKQVSDKIIQAFNTPFTLEGNQFSVSSSIGISLYPNDANSSEELIKFADTAMYHAKSQGRNNYQFYLPEMNEVVSRHVQIEAGLKQAIERNELYLVYQPKYTIREHKITGFEALLRWHSTELGSITPMEFIPVAEEIGMIEKIGHWVLNQACQQLSAWHQMGYTELNIAVNLSAKQLKTDLVSIVEVALGVANLPASALELEITESSIMNNPADAITIFTQLKTLGIALAIDDFGTGYSSLSYLKRFPVDTLKIDKEFIHDIDSQQADATITTAIIAMAKSLQLEVVAEGVENQQQLELLTLQECDQVQGFLFSKPRKATECTELLRAAAGAI